MTNLGELHCLQDNEDIPLEEYEKARACWTK